jgi:hypothetical protein
MLDWDLLKLAFLLSALGRKWIVCCGKDATKLPMLLDIQ